MRPSIRQVIAGVGILGVLAQAGLPMHAVAEAPADTNAPAATRQLPTSGFRSWSRTGPANGLPSDQRMAQRVELMGQRIQRDIGAIFAGEDAIGTGTSMTH